MLWRKKPRSHGKTTCKCSGHQPRRRFKSTVRINHQVSEWTTLQQSVFGPLQLKPNRTDTLMTAKLCPTCKAWWKFMFLFFVLLLFFVLVFLPLRFVGGLLWYEKYPKQRIITSWRIITNFSVTIRWSPIFVDYRKDFYSENPSKKCNHRMRMFHVDRIIPYGYHVQFFYFPDEEM